MNELLSLFAILTIICVGYYFYKTFFFVNKTPVLEIFSYSFGLGIGAIGLQMVLYSLLQIPWNAIVLLLPWLIIFANVIFFKRKEYSLQYRFSFSKNLFNNSLVLLIFLLILYVLFEAQLRPLYAWDGWSIWLYKAKIFFIDQGINPSHTVYFQNSYPYLLNLIIAFIYNIIGYVDDKSVLLLYPFFYISTGTLLFSSLQKCIGTTKALVFTFIFFSTQNVIRHAGRWEAGYADLPLGYFIFSSVLLLINYLSKKSQNILILLNLFLLMTSSIKNEGFYFSIIIEIILLIAIVKSKKIKNIFFQLIWLVPILIWEIYKKIYNSYPDYLFDKTIIHPTRIFVIIFYMLKESLNIQNWNILWVLFGIAFAVFLFNFKKSLLLLVYCIIFLQLLLYIAAFMLSPYDPKIHIPNVMDRLFLHIVPLALFASALAIYSKQKLRLNKHEKK